MITVLFAWIIIFFTLFSFGDLFVCLYNKICRNKEEYGISDTLILGICFAAIIVMASSLWLPTNEYILGSYVLVGIIYWIANINRLKTIIGRLKDRFLSLSLLEKASLPILIFIVLFCVFISDWDLDASYYHFQNIRWNELYPVIPGLGNMEDRLAFNSNYLLLSAVFTFRFIFGESDPIYALQSLLFVVILCSVVMKFFTSKYGSHYFILLLLLLILYYLYRSTLSTSNTDILPMLFIFYYVARTGLHMNWLKEKPLISILMPVVLVTYKLSTGFFALICIVGIIYLLKQKKLSELFFILTCATLAIGLWLTRNVILSGYLVYPMTNIDLFSFDWKIPAVVGDIQRLYINDFGKYIFLIELKNLLGLNSITLIIKFIPLIVSLLLPFIIIYKVYKRKLTRKFLILCLFTLACLGISIISAADLRFTYGYILGCSFLFFLMLFPQKSMSPYKNYLLCFLLVGFAYSSIEKFTYYSSRIKMKYETFSDFLAFYHHRTDKRPVYFEEYKMNDNIILYIALPENELRIASKIPATHPEGLPFYDFENRFDIFKIQHYKTIEARGSSLRDGFRTRKEYLDLFKRDREKYIDMYKNRQK